MSKTAEPSGDGADRALSSPMRATHRILSIICGLMLLAMMVVTLLDVIGRYMFNSPLQGATELTALLLVSTIFIGLPAVCLDEEHVTVDLLTDHLPALLQPIRRTLIRLISAGVLFVIAWRLLVYGHDLASYGETTVSLRLAVSPFAYLCSATTLIAGLITLRHVFSRS
ncbi:TRAP transporter small permease [Rhizobium sp. SSA_523]|uniref:TRAP transporter small permease n=1 Tax=Rhizobium sp. SSA_523 TaxID=2952477 RepID=UPI002090DB45|nr:TRAP transporter small permease subunit [Rhizobium sp. SSA_523]MCO5732680.1 TRAP transporter small permease [Rhizobium sp. SSA_523]WKC23692.1 TRAP transporter small permease subunit [Rhizobium sp. SSA_523]